MNIMQIGWKSLLSPPNRGKGRGPSLKQTWIPITWDALLEVWLKLVSGSEEKDFKCL